MKCWLKNNPVYRKVYEYTEAGTYTITITEDTPCKFVIVGGGGGGAFSNYYGMFTRVQNGGSGAMVQGETTLTAGTYTVVVGTAGESKYQDVGAIAGLAGGNSTFLGNTAGGGQGAYAHAGYFQTDGYDGAGGTATVVDGAIGTNGRTGDTLGIYKNQYGAGGVNSASNGFAGYAMIDIVSDSSDYTYTVVERKYYKWSYSAFSQPVLSANGVLSGDSFAVYCPSDDSAAHPAYHAFDNNSSTIAVKHTIDFIIYNNAEINITNISLVNRDGNSTYQYKGGEIYGSNDNINWTSIGVIASGSLSWDLSSNTGYYKYYKITQTGGGDWQPVQINITATQRVSVESTSSDYDFYIDINTWKAFRR